MRKWGVLLLGMLSVVACRSSPEEKLERKWTLSVREGEGFPGDSHWAEEEAYLVQELAVKTDNFFRFYPDHTFTSGSNWAPFRTGTWQLVDSTLSLTSSNQAKPMNLAVSKLTDDSLLLRLKANSHSPSAQGRVLMGKPDSFDYSKETDYYGLRLNAWRIPATRYETTEQLRERLINHLDYLIAYLRVTLEREGGEVDLSSLNSPLLLAANGIGVKSLRASARWADCFYSSDDAREAYRMLSKSVTWYSPIFKGKRAQLEKDFRREYSGDELSQGLSIYKTYLEGLREYIFNSTPTT